MLQRHKNDAEIVEETKQIHMDAVSAEFEVLFISHENSPFKLDPELMNEASDGSLNLLLLKLTCQKVVTQITKSAGLCPWLFLNMLLCDTNFAPGKFGRSSFTSKMKLERSSLVMNT